MAANVPMLDLLQNCQVWSDLDRARHAAHGAATTRYRAQQARGPSSAQARKIISPSTTPVTTDQAQPIAAIGLRIDIGLSRDGLPLDRKQKVA